MTVKNLQIGSPVYRVRLDSIDIYRVRLIEQLPDNTRLVELNTTWKVRCNAKEDATEMRNINSSESVWYVSTLRMPNWPNLCAVPNTSKN